VSIATGEQLRNIDNTTASRDCIDAQAILPPTSTLDFLRGCRVFH
jgi:hypothetical protein